MKQHTEVTAGQRRLEPGEADDAEQEKLGKPPNGIVHTGEEPAKGPQVEVLDICVLLLTVSCQVESFLNSTKVCLVPHLPVNAGLPADPCFHEQLYWKLPLASVCLCL